ncbi:U1 small nuclear ribonucleoprotein 70kDa, partial [Clonorchis sinensis]
MTQFLPPNLLALFAPRDPVPFLPPIEKHAHHRKLPYTGVAQFLGEFEVSSYWSSSCATHQRYPTHLLLLLSIVQKERQLSKSCYGCCRPCNSTPRPSHLQEWSK